MPASVPTDEIYERYLKKAISEINDLGEELARAGDELRVPVVGSGPSPRRSRRAWPSSDARGRRS